MFTYFSFFVALLCMVECHVLDRASDIEPITLTPIIANNSESPATCSRNLDGYVPSPAIGAAHKLHLWKLQWNNARRTCYDEGGQLAIINSNAERNILFAMMKKKKVKTVWLGLHDLYEKDDWTTVTGIPLAATGFSGWRKGEPNNAFGNERCVQLTLRGLRGMNDNNCTLFEPFICKISIPRQN